MTRLPVPAETLIWCDARPLEQVFREGEGQVCISVEHELVLPFHAKMTDRTGHTQHVAFIAPAEPHPQALKEGLPYAYIVTTD